MPEHSKRSIAQRRSQEPHRGHLLFHGRLLPRAEIRAEVKGGGLKVVAQIPVEGLAYLAKESDTVWGHSRKRETLLKWVDRAESIEEVNGASGHHVTVVRATRGEDG